MTEKSKLGYWSIVLKFGGKIISFLAKLLKGFKFLKAGLAIASFASYAVLFNWKFSALIMISLAVHESGHVWAMKKMGIRTKGFYFIPFIGGAAIAEEQYLTYGENAYVAIMGPVWGMLLGVISACLYFITHEPLFAAAASWIALLNLFNLFPIVPLDGGQLIRTITFSIHKNIGIVFLLISLIASIFIMFKIHVGLFALFIIVGTIELAFEFYRRYSETNRSNSEDWLMYPEPMNWFKLSLTITSYITLVAVLIAIINLMQHIPGADLAANFLADK